MGGPLPIVGPDLAAGVPLASLPDGAVLRGHAHGHAILLSRHGEVVRALGAACTHYGAPLDTGRVVGSTVRCPWHHACFDLRTGEVLRAPALRSLPRYGVAVEDGTVRVTGPLPAEVPSRPALAPASVVTVGAGAAAAAAVESLRRQGYDGPITMIGREPPVDRPNLSKDTLAGTAPEEWLPLRESWSEIGVTMRAGEVTAIDPTARVVRLADGAEVAWDALLYAPGAEPIRLPIPGAERALLLRTLADSRAIVAAAGAAGRAVVIGASFLGLEVAASLRARGLEVTVVAPEANPLERVLGAVVGAWIRRVHEGHGVVFRLGRTAAAIGPDAVLTADGERLPADLVVMAAGVRPNVGLAERAGLRVDGGVVVDAELRTSAAGIWAAGDVARWPDPHTGRLQRIEHWVLAGRQGETVARNVLGASAAFGAIPFFWSAHFDRFVNVVGFPGGDRVDVDGDLDAGSAVVAYREGDRTLAVATVGRDEVCLDAERLLEADDHEGLRGLVPVRAPG